MAGALLALAVRSDNFLPSRFVTPVWISLAVATPLAFVSQAFHAEWIVYSFTAVASASFVYLALFAAQKWFRAALANRFLVYTGTISYGLYLLHKIPLDMAQGLRLDRYPPLTLPLVLIASYAAAILSWNLLEKPVLRLKRYFESSPARHLDGTNSHFVLLVPQERETDLSFLHQQK
jgi:peptidoglycan/LPS O-acetylase OafA/YrhL